MSIPKIGDIVYVDTELHISMGSLDFVGGKAIVSKVERESDGRIWISVIENPGASYNWSHYLMLKQKELQKEFGEERAHPQPDIDTPWIEKGDLVDGEPYKGDLIW